MTAAPPFALAGGDRSLLVVGSVALDDIDGPFGLHRDLLGGSASFFATAASYFTRRVAVTAVIGDDFPERHVDGLRARGVDVSGIERRSGETFHWVGRYSDDLATRQTLDTRLGVFGDFQPRLAPVHRRSELVFLGNIHPQLQSDVLDQVEAPALVAAVTMIFWITGQREALGRTLARIDLLLINDEEARQLADRHDLVAAAAAIRALGPRALVIKRGDAGAVLFADDGVFVAPAFPQPNVRDTTGAGDTFAGGFMGYLAWAGDLAPDTLRRAMILGGVMASFSVEQFSLDGLIGLTRERIRERVAAVVELTRCGSIDL
jgi:sugar/nucleoside kinase (ribokinase family)